MPKIIFTSRFLRPNPSINRGGLVSYMAKRDGVELVTGDLIHYYGERSGVVKQGKHGLFSQTDDKIDIDKLAEEINNHNGILWTHVVSLRREDAERLGYNNVRAWQSLARRQMLNLAKEHHISLNNLRWYGAFHKEKLKTELEKVKNLDYMRADEITVASWLDQWYENYVVTTMRPSTIHNYETLIRLHIKPNIGKVKLKTLTPIYLQKMYTRLLKNGRIDRPESKNQTKGLSAKTVRNVHSVIYSACEKAVLERLISFNPAMGCKLPKKERTEMKTLPLDKLDTFLCECKASDCFEEFYLTLSTGMRRGELFGLKWEDIDTKSGFIHIKRQAQRVAGEVREMPLKTKNSYRSILVSEDIIQMLETMKTERAKQNIESEYVFCSPTGGILEPGSQRKRLQRILERCGMDKIRFHDLRHTFATLAIQNGVDVKTLSSMLGHYSAAFTLDTYTHVSPQMQKDAVKKIGDFLKQSAG